MKYRSNFKIIHGDGKDGYPEKSVKQDYDGIHIGAACESIPYFLFQQLKRGGILVIPLKRDINQLKKFISLLRLNIFLVKKIKMNLR